MQKLSGQTAFLKLLPLLALAIASGCASPVPGGVGGAGKRLIVTMTFNGSVYSNYYYYFVINRYSAQGNLNARGPVAVFAPSQFGLGGFGNGFATGSLGTGAGTSSAPDYGLTDYVEFHNDQINGVGVYHFNGDPNGVASDKTPLGSPTIFTQIPDPASGNVISTLQFTLNLSQLITDTSDATQKVQEANAIQYLQVNFIATDNVPTDPTSNGPKCTDSIGNTLSAHDQSSWLTLNLAQSNTYTSSQSGLAFTSPEPTGDVYCYGGSASPSIDLASWQIQVVNSGN